MAGRGISLPGPMKPILVLDNYDSFTWNLVHLLASVTQRELVVKRNDVIEPSELERYEAMLLSPGPGLPQEAGRMMELLEHVPEQMPLLGVCLGMQALALQTGGNLFQLHDPQHGIDTRIRIDRSADRLGLYRGLPAELTVGRYHSWMVNPEGLDEKWQITARDEKGRIMSMTHRLRNWQGLQFHPESVMTPDGKKILENWLQNPNFRPL